VFGGQDMGPRVRTGIRVSGNVNIAAVAIADAANIQVTGKAAGLPVVAGFITGALTAALAQCQSAVSGFTADAEARKKKRRRRLENPLRLVVSCWGPGIDRQSVPHRSP
jgi:hypothetical protein